MGVLEHLFGQLAQALELLVSQGPAVIILVLGVLAVGFFLLSSAVRFAFLAVAAVVVYIWVTQGPAAVPIPEEATGIIAALKQTLLDLWAAIVAGGSDA